VYVIFETKFSRHSVSNSGGVARTNVAFERLLIFFFLLVAVWVVLEQVCIAALDSQDLKLADVRQ
jgi:hypothetical protein